MKHSIIALACATLFSCQGAYANGLPAPAGGNTDIDMTSQSQLQGQQQNSISGAIAGSKAISNSSSGSVAGAVSAQSSDNSNGVTVTGDNVEGSKSLGLAFPTGASGVKANISGCTVAGVQSAGILFNMFSVATVKVVEIKFCKLLKALEVAQQTGNKEKIDEIQAVIFADVLN